MVVSVSDDARLVAAGEGAADGEFVSLKARAVVRTEGLRSCFVVTLALD
jgi:hypothetical protein